MGPHFLMSFIQSAPEELQVGITDFLTVVYDFALTAASVPTEWKIVNVKNGATNLKTWHVYWANY